MLDIVEVKTKAQMKAFIGLPYDIYRGDPTWTAPLRFMEADRFDPAKNLGLADIDPVYWLAYAGDKLVGRCASFLNHQHLARYQDETGHFGFLDTDTAHPEAIEALLDQAGAWLREKGMAYMAGPFNFSVNEESGMLIEGFDTPQMMLMPHGRADYPKALEALGFEKLMDTYAYINRLDEGYPRPPLVPKMQAWAENNPAISFRQIDMSRFTEEVKLAMSIFNDAWSENWGFVAYSDEQILHMASELKLIIDPKGVWFGEVDGVAKGFVMLIPNLNEAIRGLDGRLFPFGWAKLLYRLKVARLKTGRIPLMGIRKEVQKKRTGTALMLSLFEKAYDGMRGQKLEAAELSWVLENNKDVQNMIAMSTALIYKRYRIYRKSI